MLQEEDLLCISLESLTGDRTSSITLFCALLRDPVVHIATCVFEKDFAYTINRRKTHERASRNFQVLERDLGKKKSKKVPYIC